MSNNTDILNHTELEEKKTPLASSQREACEALLRLRKLGESLPLVDAVAVIREGRELAERSRHE
jgi:hypothetical protein